ncbi:MAG: DNA polymerase II, partial [Sedimenticola sp.]|nr:DNA polymerase II [Sedimenticola sp.]
MSRIDCEAYLLTRHWRDTPQGIELQFWASSPLGPLRLVYPGQKAVCFISRDCDLALPGTQVERKPLQLRDMDGSPVDALYFRQQRQLQQLRQRTVGSSTRLLESDIKVSDRFLMERFITAPMRVSGEAAQQAGYRQLVNPRLHPAEYTPALRYLSLDIETDGSASQVLSIAYCGVHEAQVLMQGRADDWPSDLPILWFDDEKALLRGFLQQMQRLDPDLILGWNLINFDLDYLERRCQAHRIPFGLGRGSETAAILQPQQAGQPRIASIPGRVALDGIDTLRAAFWSFDSFALDHVA